jgi:TPR repeat protein
MKKWAISIAVVLLLLAGLFWIYIHSVAFSGETLDMAHAADDRGNDAAAMQLYKEACDEGSDEACAAVYSETHVGNKAAAIRFYKKMCERGDARLCQERQALEASDGTAKLRK